MQAPRGEVIYESSNEYDKLTKKEKAKRFDPVIAVTGCNHDYTSRYLPNLTNALQMPLR